MRSAKQCPQLVNEYLTAEVAAGWIAGPIDATRSQQLQISHFGVILKTRANQGNGMIYQVQKKQASTMESERGVVFNALYFYR